MAAGTPSSVGHKLLSASVLRVGNLIAAAVSALFLMPFIVHHLGDRLYGFWALAAGFIGYYSLLDMGLSSAVTQYLSIAIGRNEPAECRAVFNTALRIQSLFGVIALLVTVLLAAAAPWFCSNAADASLFWKVIAILGVNAALSFPARTYGGVLDALVRFDIYGWLGLLGLVLRTALIIGAILQGGGLLALAWMTLLASLPVFVLQIWFARREAAWVRIDNAPVDSKRTKSLFSYSVYTFMAYVADILRFQIDPLVISGFIGLAAVTHYKIAGVLAQYYLQIIVLSVGMLQPILSRLHGTGDRVGLEKVFFFGTKVSLWISMFICFALTSWGKPFIARWMGLQYEDAYWPLVVLSFAVLLDVGQKPSIDLLYATFKHRFYAYLNFAEGIINLLFSLALARPFGILGVALGTLISACVMRAIAQPWWVCKVSGLPYGEYMKFVGGNLLRCGGMTGAAIVLAAWGLRPSYPWLVMSAICAIAIYAAGSWFIVFTGNERKQLLAAITNRSPKYAEAAAVEVALS